MSVDADLQPGVMLRAALDLASRGYWVFPVLGRRGGDAAARWKAPARVGRWSVESTRDPERIRGWFEGDDDLGVAIDCGRSGIVMLDGDHPDLLIKWARELGGPAVLEGVASWQGNRMRRSWLFAQPEDGDPIGCPTRPWGECKGAGGYVVAPPSPHPIAGNYQWLLDAELTPLPAALADDLRGGRSGRLEPAEVDATPDQVREFFETHTTATRPAMLDVVMSKYRESVSAGAGRYPSVRDCLVWALCEAAAGLYPAKDAAVALGAAYREDLSHPPVRRFDPTEWQRLLSWAVGRALASDIDERLARVAEVEPSVPMLDLDGLDMTDPEAVDLAMMAYQRDVMQRVRTIQIDRDAKKYIAQKDYQPAPAAVNLTDLFNEELDEMRWRVGGPSQSDEAIVTPTALDNTGLLAIGGSVVLTGPRKAGKTSLVLDLVRCLADGMEFLNRYPVDRPDGGVFIMDYESTRQMAKKWYSEAGIMHPERVFLKLLRGQPNPYSTEQGREDLIAEIRATKATVLIADPLSVLLEDLREDEQDNAATRHGLDDLRRLAQQAGINEVIVIAHTGKDGSRGARGASSIEDWPDAIWRLDVEEVDGQRVRWFQAFGRDVLVEERMLTYDHASRSTTITTRKRHDPVSTVDEKNTTDKARIVQFLTAARAGDAGDTPGMRSFKQITAQVAGLGPKGRVEQLLSDLVNDGLITSEVDLSTGSPQMAWRAVVPDEPAAG